MEMTGKERDRTVRIVGKPAGARDASGLSTVWPSTRWDKPRDPLSLPCAGRASAFLPLSSFHGERAGARPASFVCGSIPHPHAVTAPDGIHWLGKRRGAALGHPRGARGRAVRPAEASMSMMRTKGERVGKTAKARGRRGAAGRRGGAAPDREALVAALPKLDVLRDVPSFSDLRADAAQVAAFEEFASAVGREDGGAADEMRLGFVVRLDRGFPLVATDGGTFRAEHAVGFAKRRGEGERLLPAIGDCVAVRVAPGHDMGVIERVLPRRTVFERWRGKSRGERQVLAANVDTVLIVQPLGSSRDTPALVRDRIARSLVLVRDCGAEPVVVLTKADRCDAAELARTQAEVRRLAGGDVRVLATSSATGEGLDEVRSCVPAGSCAMILGESGAGKSTLLNALLGHEALATGEVRERDDMGRHTTVARVMVSLPDPCGVIADAPGLRSLPLVGHERGLARAFPEIVAAARGCRFNDCTHTHEPGCAVRAAVGDGEVDELRLEAFLSLAVEMRVSAQSLDPDVHL